MELRALSAMPIVEDVYSWLSMLKIYCNVLLQCVVSLRSANEALPVLQYLTTVLP